MSDTLKIALAQLNPTMGDIAGNLALLRRARAEAGAAGADLVVATELASTGYPDATPVLEQTVPEAGATATAPVGSATGDGGTGLTVRRTRRAHPTVRGADGRDSANT